MFDTLKNFCYLKSMTYRSGVYVIRCTPTGELYVGRTKNAIEARLAEHKTKLARGVHHAPKLQARYATYGLEAFEFIILKRFPPKLVAFYEQDAIRKLKPALNAYNARTAKIMNLARASGVAPNTIRLRMKRGLRGEALVQKPYGAKRRVKVRGELLYPYEIAEKYDLPLALVKGRFYAGLVGEALIRPRHVRT